MIAAQVRGVKSKVEYDQILANESAVQAQAAKQEAEREKAAQDAAEANCRNELQCWAEKHFAAASVYCLSRSSAWLNMM